MLAELVDGISTVADRVDERSVDAYRATTLDLELALEHFVYLEPHLVLRGG